MESLALRGYYSADIGRLNEDYRRYARRPDNTPLPSTFIFGSIYANSASTPFLVGLRHLEVDCFAHAVVILPFSISATSDSFRVASPISEKTAYAYQNIDNSASRSNYQYHGVARDRHSSRRRPLNMSARTSRHRRASQSVQASPASRKYAPASRWLDEAR